MRPSQTFRRFWTTMTISVLAVFISVPLALAANWASLTSGIATGVNLQKIDFSTDGQYGIAVGTGGVVARSTDFGKTWTSQVLTPNTTTHSGISFAPGTQTAWMVSSDGRIRKTEDAGGTWEQQEDFTFILRGVYAVNADKVWAVGTSKVLRTIDGGENWEQADYSGTWRDVASSDDGHRTIIVGDGGRTLTTTNGFLVTELADVQFDAETVTGMPHFKAVAFKTSATTLAVAADKTLYKYDGATWTSVTLPAAVPATTDLFDVWMKPGSQTNAVIAGESGYILESTDNGANWTAQVYFAPTPKTWNGVYASTSDVNYKFAVGNEGTIARFDAIPPQAPTGIALTGGTPTNDTKPTFTWTAAVENETSLKGYTMYIDGMFKDDPVPVTSWTALQDLADGQHTFELEAYDVAANTSAKSTAFVFIVDTTAPVIAAPSPTVATAGVATNIKANISESNGIASCNLFVNSADQGAMTVSGEASSTHTFATAGNFSVRIKCLDTAGNLGQSSETTVVVSSTPTPSPSPTPPPSPTPSPTPTPPTPPPAPGDECADFTDVAATHPDCDAIEYVKSIGAMTGNPDGTFAPSGLLQRDQIAKITLETFNNFDTSVDYCGGVNPFPDVTLADWSFQYVCRGKALGIITGYMAGEDAGFYRPGRSVNRVEFLALLLRNLTEAMPSLNSTSYLDVTAGQWFSGYARYSLDHSLFTGNNLFPSNFTTRLEVAQIIFKLHEQGKI